MKEPSTNLSLVLCGLLVTSCASEKWSVGLISTPAGKEECELVVLSHVTFSVPGVSIDDGVNGEEAKALAEFYRDQFLKNAPVIYDSEDAISYSFKTVGDEKIVVAKNGDRVTRKGVQTLHYAGASLWCWSAGND